MSSILMPFPRQGKVLEDTREQLVIELPLPYGVARAIRTAILFGACRDERLLDVYSSMIYRNIDLRENLVGLSAEVGLVTAWLTPPHVHLDLGRIRGLIQGATDQALRPLDRWRVNPVQICTTTPDGLVDVNALPEGSPLIKPATVWGLGSVRT